MAEGRRPPLERRGVVRVGDDGAASAEDGVATEEPLEIRLADETLAVTMRTPGHDRQLALGFVWAEGLIGALDEVGALHHCGRTDEPGYGNAIELSPAPGVALDPDALLGARRGTLTTAACGVCGRQHVDDLLAHCQPLPERAPLEVRVLHAAAEALARHQPLFEQTGGSHAALALDATGQVLAAHEDVGRHNAVDKVVGQLLLDGRIDARGEQAPRLLVVSGRASFEIVQKAAMARIDVVAAVSAPTTLACELAERVGITLAGFVRDGRATLYTHPDAIRLPAHG